MNFSTSARRNWCSCALGVSWLIACGRDVTGEDLHSGGASSAAAGSSTYAGAPVGGSSSPPNVGGAGATSTAGTAGSSGLAGASPEGGAAGGVATGGSGGTPAVAGTAGTAGVAGTAGTAGVGGTAGTAGAMPYQPISFGTKLDPAAQVAESSALASRLVAPNSPGWRAKGDQRRTYRFEEAGADVAYRVCVPDAWDGTSPLPLVMFLHGAGNDESSYLDQNGKQMVQLAAEHGVVLVSPLGYGGAYGNFLRLNAGFSAPEEAAKLIAKRTPADERTQELSEKDVINVLELVLHEYPIDRSKMFLTGHSMGSGGTWYLGGKYASYWAALAPMSGPFVLEHGYPWQGLKGTPLLVSEGTGAASLSDSRTLRDWLKTGGFDVTYLEVEADHAGMVRLVLPRVFSFFDEVP